MLKEEITQILGASVREAMEEKEWDWKKLQEIRLRIGQPVFVIYQNQEYVLPVRSKEGIITRQEIRETVEYMSHYSLYAYEHEMSQGFLTLEGGHRVGIAGQVIVESGKVKNLKYISSVNIRVSHEILECSKRILPYVTSHKQLCHTLIVSPPGCGKTTLLRDLIRQVSDGNEFVKGCSVGVVDERSEIGGCYLGIAQNHLGRRTDILDCCPKAEGMIMLIRSMTPRIIAVDEIGTSEDVRAISYAMHCGCKMLATVHSHSIEELRKKPLFEQMMLERRFERYVVLKNTDKIGVVEGIYDERGSLLYRE